MLIELLLFATIMLEYHLVRVSSFLLMTLSLGMVHSLPQDGMCQMYCWLILAVISLEITTRNINYKLVKPDIDGFVSSRIQDASGICEDEYKCYIQKMIQIFVIGLFMVTNVIQIISSLSIIYGCDTQSLFIDISLWCVLIRSCLIIPIYIIGQISFIFLDPNQNYRAILRYIRRQMENIK